MFVLVSDVSALASPRASAGAEGEAAGSPCGQLGPVGRLPGAGCRRRGRRGDGTCYGGRVGCTEPAAADGDGGETVRVVVGVSAVRSRPPLTGTAGRRYVLWWACRLYGAGRRRRGRRGDGTCYGGRVGCTEPAAADGDGGETVRVMVGVSAVRSRPPLTGTAGRRYVLWWACRLYGAGRR